MSGAERAVGIFKNGFNKQPLGACLNSRVNGAHGAGGDRIAHPWLHQFDRLTNFNAITELGRDINARFERVVFDQHGEDITLAKHIAQLDLHISDGSRHWRGEVAVTNGGLLSNRPLP